jgi:hypothetical protein
MQPDNHAVAVPKLNVVAVSQLPGLLCGLGIVGANPGLKPNKVFVSSD